MVGTLIFTFLMMPDLRIPFWTHGWATTPNIYSQVGTLFVVSSIYMLIARDHNRDRGREAAFSEMTN
jgi:hypothetical protein